MSRSQRDNYDLVYLSLGAGVQSSALYVLACQGRIDPAPTVAIFADTQAEPRYVYDYLDVLEQFGGDKIPIRRVTAGNLHDDSIRGRFMRLPAFGENGAAMIRRQCTREYKVAPITKEVRSLLGLRPRQRCKGLAALCYIGISMDEAQRMKPNRESFIDNAWPLIDMRLYRNDCERIVLAAGLPKPNKSACVFCPYHSNAEWRLLRDEHPGDWRRAVEFDAAIRNSTKAGVKMPVYVHRSCKPLSEAPIDGDTAQSEFAFMNECEGMCGV